MACSDRATVQNESALTDVRHHTIRHRRSPANFKAGASPRDFRIFCARLDRGKLPDQRPCFPRLLLRRRCLRSFRTVGARVGSRRTILFAASGRAGRRIHRTALVLPTADRFGFQLRVRERFARRAFHAADITAAAGIFHARVQGLFLHIPSFARKPERLKFDFPSKQHTLKISCGSSWHFDATCITRECCSQAISPGLASSSTALSPGTIPHKFGSSFKLRSFACRSGNLCHVTSRCRLSRKREPQACSHTGLFSAFRARR